MDCGYCGEFIRILPEELEELQSDNECICCPLFDRKVCVNDAVGDEKNWPYWIVSYSDWKLEPERALKAARLVLAAIMEDDPYET